ncbi:aldehyde dehydrogenase 3B2 [Verticillium dahliae VdLs.17]|uniref:Aldehyde dehydrogenase 3B2 n=1 Tax=Verticillium dahliae (strain VdLs.17 / ATCC MYA-4575 / FGSC 10137) TaxID=498257 RepID=G2X384_VERDV|nr:aldehyde dehydrogenase 3B2 [Verticillium dahliae VdLs.17]EGY23431.1 aldehyde dehydrogenase 3B2 [Verticillium dahliae VdLs.17]
MYYTPLALFAFSNEEEAKKILDRTMSGSATINDVLSYTSSLIVPFGGVG